MAKSLPSRSVHLLTSINECQGLIEGCYHSARFLLQLLLDQANYLNRFYLVSLLSFLLIFLPTNRGCSFDARLRPSLRRRSAPAWTLWLLRFQLGVPYFYGGLAKLGGLLFDLLIVPMLLFKKTRWIAVFWIVAFHLINSQLFRIGIFPWFMLLATPVFLPPERISGVLRALVSNPGMDASRAGLLQLADPTPRAAKLTTCAIAAFVAFQLMFPLRHCIYPGNVSWTEEGHRFSWHMKLRDKDARAMFLILDSGSSQNDALATSPYGLATQLLLKYLCETCRAGCSELASRTIATPLLVSCTSRRGRNTRTAT